MVRCVNSNLGFGPLACTFTWSRAILYLRGILPRRARALTYMSWVPKKKKELSTQRSDHGPVCKTECQHHSTMSVLATTSWFFTFLLFSNFRLFHMPFLLYKCFFVSFREALFLLCFHSCHTHIYYSFIYSYERLISSFPCKETESPTPLLHVSVTL